MFDSDRIEYTAWDALGRPTGGTIHFRDETQPVTLTYDDARRRVEASNGEASQLDADGNLVEEVLAEGFGPSYGVVRYVIEATAQACK
jgi:YD repeat-containing protein